jgi:hypothetical protein
VDYQQLRSYGKTSVSWNEKLRYGLIKNDFYVQSFSDRDVAAFEAPFRIRDLGHKKANQKLIDMSHAVEPDILIAGHCDIITNKTLARIKSEHPNCTIVHCNNDGLFNPSNVERLKYRAEVADAVFVSTGRKELTMLEGIGARIYHMPNPVEPSIDVFDNSKETALPIDLLFCSHATKHTNRLDLVNNIRNAVGSELNFQVFGSDGQPSIWGRDYERVLSQTKMGLNLNRQNNFYWYSSARMAQLAGNGILQFTHSGSRFDELLPSETVVYFDNESDLAKKILEFHHDDEKRQTWASRCREFFHQEMNTTLYSRYIVEAALEIPFSHDYVWAQDINLNGTLKSN